MTPHLAAQSYGKSQVRLTNVTRHPDRDGQPHPHAFTAGGAGRRTCEVRHSREGTTIEAGLTGLTVVKTTGSAFRDFHRDEFTTLPDVDDRLFGTAVEARWQAADFGAAHAAVRRSVSHDRARGVRRGRYHGELPCVTARLTVELLHVPRQLTGFGVVSMPWDLLVRGGTVVTPAGPVAAEQAALWEALADGRIAFVASDHSPAPPAVKMPASDNFFAVWGGIAGVQTTLGLMLEEGHARRGLSVGQISGVRSDMPARRYRLVRPESA